MQSGSARGLPARRPEGARGPGEQAASRSPWSAAGTPASCCARCWAACFSQVRRGWRGCRARRLWAGAGPGPGARGTGRLPPGEASSGGNRGPSSQRARGGHGALSPRGRLGAAGRDPQASPSNPAVAPRPRSELGLPRWVAARVPCQAPGRSLPAEAPGARSTAHAVLPATQSQLPGGLERVPGTLRSPEPRLLDARKAAGTWATLAQASRPEGEGGEQCGAGRALAGHWGRGTRVRPARRTSRPWLGYALRPAARTHRVGLRGCGPAQVAGTRDPALPGQQRAHIPLNAGIASLTCKF